MVTGSGTYATPSSVHRRRHPAGKTTLIEIVVFPLEIGACVAANPAPHGWTVPGSLPWLHHVLIAAALRSSNC